MLLSRFHSFAHMWFYFSKRSYMVNLTAFYLSYDLGHDLFLQGHASTL